MPTALSIPQSSIHEQCEGPYLFVETVRGDHGRFDKGVSIIAQAKRSVSHTNSTASVRGRLGCSPSILVHDPGIRKHVDRESLVIQVIRHDITNVPTTVSVPAKIHMSPPQMSVTHPEQFGLYGPRGKSAIDQGSSRSELGVRNRTHPNTRRSFGCRCHHLVSSARRERHAACHSSI
jgi:hypothetical protein